MRPLLAAHHWVTAMAVTGAASLIALIGGEWAVSMPLVSQPVPMAVLLSVVSATVCVLPLQPSMPPLDWTFVRERALRRLRPVAVTAFAALPTVLAGAAPSSRSMATDSARLLVLSGVALVAVTFWAEIAWMPTLSVGLVAVIVDGSNPSHPVSAFLQWAGPVSCLAFWVACLGCHLHWGRAQGPL